MNKAFTKNNKIELDDKYSLTPDSDYGIILTFSEIRQRKNKETKETEDYLFTSHWFFPKISQALNQYVKLTQNSSTSIENILDEANRIGKVIDRIDREFKQF